MNREEAIIQNLQDAGCTQEFIKEFMTKFCKEKKLDELRLLQSHRCILLDTLHKAQKEIDCLDYLVYQLQKQ